MLFEIDVINKTIILKSPVELKDIEKIFSEILIGWQDYKIIQGSYVTYTYPLTYPLYPKYHNEPYVFTCDNKN